MANASATKTKIETEIKNQIDQNFELDFSQNCDSAIDASQNISDIEIVGSRDVAINQVNQALSLCQAKQILDMELLTKLSAQTQQDIVKSLEQEGGIGINVSETNSEMLNKVKNEVGIDAYIDLSQKCLQSVDASQNISNVRIEDAQNIDISQANQAFNKCLADNKASLASEHGLDFEAGQALDLQETQTGWDPIASISGVLAGLGMFALIPFIGCGVVCVLVSVASAMTNAGGGSGEGDLSQAIQGFDPQMLTQGMQGIQGISGQMGGAINSITKYIKKNKVKVLIVLLVIIALYLIMKEHKKEKHQKHLKEQYHNRMQYNHHPRLDRPFALRSEYHAPHISQDRYPDLYPDDYSDYPLEEVPEYVKRWW